jgi:hypothetical protein
VSHENDGYEQSFYWVFGSGGFVPSVVASVPELLAEAPVDMVGTAFDRSTAPAPGTTKIEVAPPSMAQEWLRMTPERKPPSMHYMD